MPTTTQVIRILSLIGLLIGTPLWGQENESTGSIARRYVELLTATWQEKATPQDLDALLSLYAEDAVYEHPRVGARIQGKDQIRMGMGRFHGATRNPRLRIKSTIVGRGVVILEMEVQAEAKGEEAWEPLSRTQVTVLETDGTRIRRIADYW
jgi:ketosteroid isomerase-like protein